MTDDLEKLSEWLTPLLAKLDSDQRKKLMQTVARDLRRRNQQRIRRQTDPDGTRWERRKIRQPVNKPVKFIYHGKVRVMRSWQDQGDRMTGYDTETNGIKTFVKDRIEKWLPPPSAGGSGMRANQGKIKRAAMFTKLRTARYLKINTDPDTAAIQWTGRIARIANIHHHGKRAPVAPGGPEYDFPERRLIGFAREDHTAITDLIIKHLAEDL